MHSAPNLGPVCAHRCAQAARTAPRPRALRRGSAHCAVSWRALGCIVVVPDRVHPPPGMPKPACLLRLLRACSACCVPAQAAVCHNTAEPTVCLLSLLCATIQLSLPCACPAFYVPQYCRTYCVPTQPSMCHNTACCIVTQF